MKTKQANIRDVAGRAGVSIATVSRILNGGGSFSAGTIQKVRKAVRDLGYRRSSGSLLRAKSDSPTVALVVSDIDLLDPYYWELVRGLYDTVGIHSCNVSLRVFRGLCDDGEGLGEELRRAGVAGALFVPSVATGGTALGPGDGSLPLVFLDRVLPGRTESAVVADNREGAGQAARYLARLGHRRIAYLGSPAALGAEREKREGFLNALSEEGLTLAPEDIIEGGVERSGARDALRERLARPRGFSALFASSDLLAFGAKEALDQAGIGVPRDLSLVGFGNIPFSAALGLTTIGVPAYQMGRSAFLLLLDLIQGRVAAPRRDTVSAGLIIRSSCGRFP